jgi:hypothetical protein
MLVSSIVFLLKYVTNKLVLVSILNFHHLLNYVGKIKIFLNMYNYFINMIQRQHNLLDAKMKNALVKYLEEIKSLAPFFILKS